MAVHRKSLPVVASWTFVAVWTLGWAWHMWPDSGVSWQGVRQECRSVCD